jgi:hypothetical protein
MIRTKRGEQGVHLPAYAQTKQSLRHLAHLQTVARPQYARSHWLTEANSPVSIHNNRDDEDERRPMEVLAGLFAQILRAKNSDTKDRIETWNSQADQLRDTS